MKFLSALGIPALLLACGSPDDVGGAGGAKAPSSTGASASCQTDVEPAACASCLEASCCAELAACLGDATCEGCLDDDPATPCEGDAKGPLEACVEAECADACGGARPEPACYLPAEPPSGGSCVTLGGAVACNPVTAAPCKTAEGESCDGNKGEGFKCFPGPNEGELCEACDPAAGDHCKAGHTCYEGVCARYCCDDADCGEARCEPIAATPVGVCVTDGGGA